MCFSSQWCYSNPFVSRFRVLSRWIISLRSNSNQICFTIGTQQRYCILNSMTAVQFKGCFWKKAGTFLAPYHTITPCCGDVFYCFLPKVLKKPQDASRGKIREQPNKGNFIEKGLIGSNSWRQCILNKLVWLFLKERSKGMTIFSEGLLELMNAKTFFSKIKIYIVPWYTWLHKLLSTFQYIHHDLVSWRTMNQLFEC